ncbi:unnamed protein product [Ceutorhynchus assimilis]|uniref:Spaetzle domain-containing protein n=1 Tax=Ceutorhynchus assimilis TaxID=467358 RepID=A0A9N9MMY0_9CUCU|nr:unnamed protein product [Ceutorhynchus assimilis]
MITRWTALDVWIFFILLIASTSGRPQKQPRHIGPPTNNECEEYINRTQPRILTHPPKGDFYGREQEIIFPDTIADRIDVPSRINVPKCSGALPYCEESETYPYSHIKRILQQNHMLKSVFGQDESPPSITNRLGDEDEKFVCHSIKQTIFPRVGENKNNKLKFIINQGENDEDGFVQGIQVEICKNPDGDCDIPGGSALGDEYIMTCKQKYVYRRLLTLDQKGEAIPDSFKMPSACCCAYKQNFDFLTRFGKGMTPAPKKSNNVKH